MTSLTLSIQLGRSLHLVQPSHLNAAFEVGPEFVAVAYRYEKYCEQCSDQDCGNHRRGRMNRLGKPLAGVGFVVSHLRLHRICPPELANNSVR